MSSSFTITNRSTKKYCKSLLPYNINPFKVFFVTGLFWRAFAYSLGIVIIRSPSFKKIILNIAFQGDNLGPLGNCQELKPQGK